MDGRLSAAEIHGSLARLQVRTDRAESGHHFVLAWAFLAGAFSVAAVLAAVRAVDPGRRAAENVPTHHYMPVPINSRNDWS
jgi:hypothetical protein